MDIIHKYEISEGKIATRRNETPKLTKKQKTTNSEHQNSIV